MQSEPTKEALAFVMDRLRTLAPDCSARRDPNDGRYVIIERNDNGTSARIRIQSMADRYTVLFTQTLKNDAADREMKIGLRNLGVIYG